MSEFVWSIKIDGSDVAGITLAGATIRYGRHTPEARTTASTAYLELLTPDAIPDIADKFPEFSVGPFAAKSGFVQEWEDTYIGASSRLTIGAAIEVSTSSGSGFVQEWEPEYRGSSVHRFSGRITSIEYRPGTATITAVDDLERLGRVEDSSKWADETDIVRVKRLAALAGVPIEIDGDASVMLLGRDNKSEPPEPEDSITVLDAISQAAASAGAVVYCDRTNRLHYRTRTAPINWPTAMTRIHEDSIVMHLELGAVTNEVRVNYGRDEEGRAKQVTARDEESVTAFGKRDTTISTHLLDDADAAAFAQRYVDTHSGAEWTMPDATVVLVDAPPALIDQVANLDLDDAVEIDYMPAGGPVQAYYANVIGYTESLHVTDWKITLHLAPSGFLGVAA